VVLIGSKGESVSPAEVEGHEGRIERGGEEEKGT